VNVMMVLRMGLSSILILKSDRLDALTLAGREQHLCLCR
jgi:hypothetical protein